MIAVVICPKKVVVINFPQYMSVVKFCFFHFVSDSVPLRLVPWGWCPLAFAVVRIILSLHLLIGGGVGAGVTAKCFGFGQKLFLN